VNHHVLPPFSPDHNHLEGIFEYFFGFEKCCERSKISLLFDKRNALVLNSLSLLSIDIPSVDVLDSSLSVLSG
jgi:hypothetical protein